MNKREVAEFIGKDIKTIYNWEKNNPNLYKILEFYFQKESEINPKHKELIELFDKLKTFSLFFTMPLFLQYVDNFHSDLPSLRYKSA